jgi:hypothetical protein
LTDFVDAQLNYYNACSKTLQDLSRQIGGMGIVNNAARNLPPSTPKLLNTETPTTTQFSALNGGVSGVSGGGGGSVGLPSSFTNKKTAKVLFDYEATDASEISVSANQVIQLKAANTLNTLNTTFVG